MFIVVIYKEKTSNPKPKVDIGLVDINQRKNTNKDEGGCCS